MSRMRYVLFSGLALCLVAGPALAQGLESYENPLKDAKVGEWIKSKVTYSMPMMGETPQELPAKATVVKVDETTVDIKVQMELMGTPQEQVQTVPKDKPLADLSGAMSGPMGEVQNVKIISSKVEDEDVEHDGKIYKAKKVTIEATAEISSPMAGVLPVTVNQTEWITNEIPVTGVIKSETKVKADMGGTPVELTFSQTLVEFGTGE